MKALLLVPLLAVLAACGTTASQDAPERTEYVMVSQGKGSFIYSAIMGGAEYCKVTRHRDEKAASNALQYEIVYEDGSCTVSVLKEK